MSHKRKNPTALVNLAGACVAVVLTGAAYGLIVRPLMQAQQRVDAVEREAARAAEQAQQAAAELAEAQRQLGLLGQELDSVAVQLQSPERVNRQIDRLASLAEGRSLRLTRVVPGKPSSTRWYTSIPIDMRGTGPYMQLVTFLTRVREEFPDVAIRNLKLQSQQDVVALAKAAGAAAAVGQSQNRAELASAESSATMFEVEFVWYATPEGSAGAASTPDR